MNLRCVAWPRGCRRELVKLASRSIQVGATRDRVGVDMVEQAERSVANDRVATIISHRGEYRVVGHGAFDRGGHGYDASSCCRQDERRKVRPAACARRLRRDREKTPSRTARIARKLQRRALATRLAREIPRTPC